MIASGPMQFINNPFFSSRPNTSVLLCYIIAEKRVKLKPILRHNRTLVIEPLALVTFP
jgi:hypothetical protein